MNSDAPNFVLAIGNTINAPCTIVVRDGADLKRHSMTLHVNRLTQVQADDLAKRLGAHELDDQALIAELVTGWDECPLLRMPSGTPAPYSTAAMAHLCCNVMGARKAIALAAYAAIFGDPATLDPATGDDAAKTKNS